MRVLVTGAAGFLGTHVVSKLLERGHAVRALVRPSHAGTPQEWRDCAEIVRTDLRADSALERLFDEVDVVVHLAAMMRGTPESQFVGTVVCTERLLEGMRRAGSTRRVVLASSFSVYDWTAARKQLTEDSPLESRPYERDGYAIAKIWQERLVRRFADETGWTLAVLRPGFIYGSGAAPVAAAGRQIGDVFLVVGPFTRLALTHVVNCAAAFADAVEKKAAGTFNIVDDEQVTAWRYAGRLLRDSRHCSRLAFPYSGGLAIAYAAQITSRILFPPKGGKLPGMLIPRRYRAGFKPLEFDNRRAKDVLGWKCKDYFADGCAVI